MTQIIVFFCINLFIHNFQKNWEIVEMYDIILKNIFLD